MSQVGNPRLLEILQQRTAVRNYSRRDNPGQVPDPGGRTSCALKTGDGGRGNIHE